MMKEASKILNQRSIEQKEKLAQGLGRGGGGSSSLGWNSGIT
jgi:hypothetical protein